MDSSMPDSGCLLLRLIFWLGSNLDEAKANQAPVKNDAEEITITLNGMVFSAEYTSSGNPKGTKNRSNATYT